MPLEKGKDCKIVKNEKGPLQRFKNSNLLMKKFGEIGLQVYRVITGKRTAEELRKDLDIEEAAFAAIINYMEEAGMVELSPLIKEKVAEHKLEVEETEEKLEETIKTELVEEEKELTIVPEEKIEERKEEDLIIIPEEEIKEETKVEEENEVKEEVAEEERKEEKIEEEPFELETVEEEKKGAEEDLGLSTVEKMIKEKFSDVGLKVYNLIDGSKTTDEIMKETGVSDTKLVEILNFLEDRGIIKMEGKEKEAVKERPASEGIGEVLGPDTDMIGQDPKGFPTIDIPARIGVDIIRGLKTKADLIFKYGDRGSKVMDNIDGKNDILDIALKTNLAIYEVLEVINFLLQNGAIIMKPLTRLEVKKKYGDPGFSIYKKYGREGVMLYELIDKNLSIKQMASTVTKDKEKFLDMFLFIRKVLNIEIPIDRDALLRQLS